MLRPKRELAKAKKDNEILKSHNRTEKSTLPDGKFDIIYADIAATPEISKIVDKITDTAILYLWADANQLPEALEFMKSLNFEHQNCAAYIKNQAQAGLKYLQTKHRLILVCTKNKYSTPYSWRTDSVFYESNLSGCGEVEYFGSQIEMMYPDGAYLDLISEKAMNDKWSVCDVREEV